MGVLYTNTKIFHFKDKLDSLSQNTDTITAPLHIRIKPTNVCCHSCKYCAYGRKNLGLFSKDEVKRVSISRKKMLEIADDIIEMKIKAVTFSGGGEPFVYPHFFEVIKKLSGADVKFSSLTNGSLLEGEIAELFASKGQWIRVSMDGWDDRSYSEYRAVSRGEYTKIMRNMKNFKRIPGGCYLGVSLIVDKKNAPYVYLMLSRLKEIGVDSVKISPCLVNDSSAGNNDYHRPFFKKVKKQIEKAVRSLSDDLFEIFDAYNELEQKFKKDYSWCPYIQILPVVGADLNVYSCPDKAYNLKSGIIGSIRNQRFRDFWFADKGSFFKINPSLVCNHHCERNQKNKLILEYLTVDKNHLEFM